jgi:hypothetical protein
MADLNIPNLNMNSSKYIFKKNLTLRRKSKRRLLTESALMFIFSLLLFYITYLIPNKILLFKNLPINFNKSFVLIIELFSNFLEIFLVIFIFLSLSVALILFVGSFYRVLRIVYRKKRQINYR